MKGSAARIGTALCLMAAALPAARAQADTQAQTIGEAFDYAYPLYLLSTYRWTALETTSSRTSTTLDHFAHSRKIATPDDKWANGPIVEALYSTAWIDLARGPVILRTPDTHDRYTVLTLIDFYSNTFFYAGRRTTGTGAQQYWLVGPDWKGEAPAGMTAVRASTNDVYVNLRVAVDGPADQQAANAVQDGFTITPAGTPSSGAQPPGPPPRLQPVSGDPKNFVDVVNQMLALDPPPERDEALIEKYRSIGICGAPCSWDALPDATKAAWRASYPKLENQFFAWYLAQGHAHGWINYSPPGNKLGTTEQRDYQQRAFALALGMGMLGLDRREANYWNTFADAQGQPLTGGKRYRLRLPAGGIPSNAFWSITLYSADKSGQFLVDNPMHRYQISSRTPNVKTDADGSIEIWLQSDPPAADKLSNWLPTPAGGQPFMLFARAYEPKSSVLSGAYRMPGVEALP
ncbi:DUF1254 domain-containing protein [Paraburkholderia oxyphila]|uniref:DUF1254 domain-containing protein n=1 Tax=Paraburkholderia oxyphila TaxID=614212 RepID=UPI0004873066|nr:DUF1254 domain-containing protein [Paraburkholderia oxyphila]